VSRIDLKREVWLAVAAQQARLSTCLRAQVGCVLLRQDGSVAGTGYNGSLPGRAHCDPQTCNPTSRCYRTRHAERSALDYSSGPIWAAYVTHEPCLSCVKDLLARGCQQIYFSNRYPTKDPGESAAKRQHLRESFAHWVWCGEKMSYKCGLGLGTVWCTTCNDEGCDWCGFLPVPK
jgi:dCMP deaminase